MTTILAQHVAAVNWKPSFLIPKRTKSFLYSVMPQKTGSNLYALEITFIQGRVMDFCPRETKKDLSTHNVDLLFRKKTKQTVLQFCCCACRGHSFIWLTGPHVTVCRCLFNMVISQINYFVSSRPLARPLRPVPQCELANHSSCLLKINKVIEQTVEKPLWGRKRVNSCHKEWKFLHS